MVEMERWRRPLRKDLAWLRRAGRFRRWSARRTSLYERRLVIVAAQVQVIADHGDLPPTLVSQPLGCVRYAPLEGARVPPRLDPAQAPGLFDLARPAAGVLAVDGVCRRILHHALLTAISREPRRYTHLWMVEGGEGARDLHEVEAAGLLAFFARFAEEGLRPERGRPAAAERARPRREDRTLSDARSGR